jgi:hypothetical protein
MQIRNLDKHEVTLALSDEEVGLLSVAIAEMLHHFSEAQFHPRTGFYKHQAEALLGSFDDVYEKIKKY